MKYLAAYLMLHLAGKTPDAAGVKAVLAAVEGLEIDEDKLAACIAALEGKNLDEVVESGYAKLMKVSGGGGGGGGDGGAAAVEEEKVEEEVRARLFNAAAATERGVVRSASVRDGRARSVERDACGGPPSPCVLAAAEYWRHSSVHRSHLLCLLLLLLRLPPRPPLALDSNACAIRSRKRRRPSAASSAAATKAATQRGNLIMPANSKS